MRSIAYFSHFILAAIATIAASDLQWQKQLGTAEHPKLPSYTSLARKGQIFSFGVESLYMSLFDGQLTENEKSEDNGDRWLPLTRGTFLLPKLCKTNVQLNTGDILFDSSSSSYYIYSGTSGEQLSIDGCAVDSTLWNKGFLTPYNYSQDWMTQLHPVIGDRRFGDIVLPGTHDSGSWGITEDSMLVDQNFLYQLGVFLTPETIANWSLTQSVSFMPQLNAGFRNLDLRIADMQEKFNDTYRWWHGMTGDPIFDGLAEIRDFAAAHPKEVLYLFFQHFAAPGDDGDSTKPISNERKEELAEIILNYLSAFMVPKDGLSDNPTINEILATGRNVIAQMEDTYIRSLYDEFWPVVVHSSWSGETNPEGLFLERSAKLENFLEEHSDSITDISGCNTPGVSTVVASLLTVYGDVENITNIIEEIFPAILEVEPAKMSFEGLYTDLFTMALEGTNTLGMRARPLQNYTNGASVHYSGVNDMLPYWLARPQRYKVNIIYTDSFESSSIVDTAISANLGQIPHQVTIAHQGNPLDGYLKTINGLETVGGDYGLACTPSLARYNVASRVFALQANGAKATEWTDLPVGTTVDISEGEYPPDASVAIQASSDGVNWHDVFTGNVQQMIDNTFDIYLRTSDLGSGRGFAYISKHYNSFCESCTELPRDNYLTVTSW